MSVVTYPRQILSGHHKMCSDALPSRRSLDSPRVNAMDFCTSHVRKKRWNTAYQLYPTERRLERLVYYNRYKYVAPRADHDLDNLDPFSQICKSCAKYLDITDSTRENMCRSCRSHRSHPGNMCTSGRLNISHLLKHVQITQIIQIPPSEACMYDLDH